MHTQFTPQFELHDLVAIGEVGIDLYWAKTYRQEQIAAFHVFIDWAYKYDLPLIIHARDSLTKIMEEPLSGKALSIFSELMKE